MRVPAEDMTEVVAITINRTGQLTVRAHIKRI